MKEAIQQALLPALSLLLAASLLFWGVGNAVINSMPPWRDSVGNFNHTEKITGTYLVEQSAAQEDTLLIFGSSELRTTEISTHPANFFAGKRAGFQVDLIGRGSCQSLIHALQIAASGDSLAGEKIVLITSPQSFVPEGIAPDLFYANFSYEQYLAALEDEDLSDEVKATLSARVAELLAAYEQTDGTSPVGSGDPGACGTSRIADASFRRLQCADDPVLCVGPLSAGAEGYGRFPPGAGFRRGYGRSGGDGPHRLAGRRAGGGGTGGADDHQ